MTGENVGDSSGGNPQVSAEAEADISTFIRDQLDELRASGALDEIDAAVDAGHAALAEALGLTLVQPLEPTEQKENNNG